MFDQSGDRKRIFIHPAVAQDMFNLPPPPQNVGNKNSGGGETGLRPSDPTEVNAKKQAYRQMVAAALMSFQSTRASRQSDLGCASFGGQPAVSVACLSGTKRSWGAASGSLQENTEDLDALMSADDDDDDVRSTGHSPDLVSQDESCEVEEGEEGSSKRRKIEGGKPTTEEKQKAGEGARWCKAEERASDRRLKIKKTVKKLRSMIPGGSSLEATLVLDKIILYVKTLRDRVQQLETTRFHRHPALS